VTPEQLETLKETRDGYARALSNLEQATKALGISTEGVHDISLQDVSIESLQALVGRVRCSGCGYEAGPDGENDGLVARQAIGNDGIYAVCNYCDDERFLPVGMFSVYEVELALLSSCPAGTLRAIQNIERERYSAETGERIA